MRADDGVIRDHIAGDPAGSPGANLNADLNLISHGASSSDRVVGQGAPGVCKGAGNTCGAIIVQQARLHDEVAGLRPDREGADRGALDSRHACGFNSA